VSSVDWAKPSPRRVMVTVGKVKLILMVNEGLEPESQKCWFLQNSRRLELRMEVVLFRSTK
jgi:hypothetical protein